jgi:hypothetical protein
MFMIFKISLIPLSVFEGNTTNTQAADETTLSSQVPIKPQPANILTTGIKLYDELGQAMINNPLNPPDPGLVAKLAKIGIAPGKIPSVETNDTIKTALQTGIQKGEKLIDARIANIGSVMNGWSFNTQTGIYGNDYLTRAAITKLGFGANIPQEALYPTTLQTTKENHIMVSTNMLFTSSQDRLHSRWLLVSHDV